MGQGSEQESPELAFARIEAVEIVAFEQSRKELLGKILGIFYLVALPEDKQVKGQPISPAQMLESRGAFR
jgi:hypothetical protein